MFVLLLRTRQNPRRLGFFVLELTGDGDLNSLSDDLTGT